MRLFFAIFTGIFMFLTLAVLMVGVFNMGRGGEFNRRHSNRLMRMRVFCQGMAVIGFIGMMAS